MLGACTDDSYLLLLRQYTNLRTRGVRWAACEFGKIHALQWTPVKGV